MADSAKYLPVGGAIPTSDFKTFFSLLKTRKTVALGYAFMLAFVAFTVFLAFSPSPNASSPWFTNIFTTSSVSSPPTSSDSHFSSLFSFLFPHSPSSPQTNATSRSINSTSQLRGTATDASKPASLLNQTLSSGNSSNSPLPTSNHTIISSSTPPKPSNLTADSLGKPPLIQSHEQTSEKSDAGTSLEANRTATAAPPSKISVTPPPREAPAATPRQNISSALKSNSPVKTSPQKSNNYTASLAKKPGNGTSTRQKDDLMESLMKCDLFDGEWVKDDSYPLYQPGSCDLIDEQFKCIRNGRPDKDFEKYKWKPKGCTLPRLDGHRMLELLRGKRLVFVGDSLNRNMWESLICILRNSVKDKRKVYEANGRIHFRGEAFYSFIFKDYKFSVELFVSPFLVQEWEVTDKNGTKKQTLRLDLVTRASDQYKDADIIIFNTGHWWTHEKTSRGKDYYQEGSHVYDELNVLEAFRRAITTWSRWVDANINPSKSLVFFRGYSASHFSGGQWNSGGQCDNETEPIKNEEYLREYPPKMMVLEKVLKFMKTHVTYLNITRMTDFRKDGHPSMYRKQNLSPEDRRSPHMFQDCSHWCLPGVPDTWNEILYAELLLRQYRNQHPQQNRP
ncbi:protein trichome birefringence-like [Prosopis cineraria]|uniref:protein trichome birefringence-like n=1 Tax=Prosopis cineraria TaxID=364024 RepID=UPI00240EBF4F|nr:protein trichome birefringence-like [Prosopis cineraria]